MSQSITPPATAASVSDDGFGVRVAVQTIGLFAVFDDALSKVPLAAFLCEAWAMKWRDENCATGIIRGDAKTGVGLSEQEAHKIKVLQTPNTD